MSHIRLDPADAAELAEILEHLIDYFDDLATDPEDCALTNIASSLDDFRHQLLRAKILP